VIATSFAAAFLSGCAVGPDFEKPAAPAVSSCTRTAPAATASVTGVTTGEAQNVVQGRAQRPFALVIVAGLITRLAISIFLMPALYLLVARDGDRLEV